MDKTVVVSVERLVQDQRYKKYVPLALRARRGVACAEAIHHRKSAPSKRKRWKVEETLVKAALA
jgi:ribosomal protein S17